MKQLIFAIVIALLAVIFALQNSAPVKVNLYFWEVNISLALLIILLLVMGIVTGLLIMSKKVYNKHSQLKALQKQQK
jgi:putative membrane protein